MSDNKSTLDELFEDGRAIDEALKEAARDARRLHKALGNPMATWRDGQVVLVQPEDINIDDDSEQEPDPAEWTFLIADTFTDSLARLTGDEQKAVKTTAFDLQMDPSAPGLSFHRLDKAKDKRFWSVRVNADIRLIVHRTDTSLLLCYVDHHDRAYAWAERRKLETHPTTGAAQLVEIRESVREIVVPAYVQAEAKPKPHDEAPRRDFGRSAARLRRAGGVAGRRSAGRRGRPARPGRSPAGGSRRGHSGAGDGRHTASAASRRRCADPFAHPDAQRRFRVVTSVEELERALDAPWDKWTVFLHPEQRNWSPTTTPGLLASQAPPARARPSSRCTAPSIWHGRIRTAASC